MMAAVAVQAESIAPYERWNDSRVRRTESDPAYTVAHNACIAARELHLDALIVPTLSGRSARLVSAHRPIVPICALSPGRETVRRCALMWGVQAASMRRHEVTETLIADAARRVVELGWCRKGDRIGEIVVRGPRASFRSSSSDPRYANRLTSIGSSLARIAVTREELRRQAPSISQPPAVTPVRP
jgi:pyruvate kinase